MLTLAALLPACRDRPPEVQPPEAAEPSEHEAKALYARRLGDRETRAEVARDLGRAKAVLAAEPLRAAARDPDPEIRAACLWALGEIGDASVAEGVAFYVSDPDLSVRLAAVEALGELASPTAVRALAEASRSDRPAVRLAAVGAMAHHAPDADAMRALVRALGDPDASIRDAAADQVLRAGDPALRHLDEVVLVASPDALLRVIPAMAEGEAPEMAPVLVRMVAALEGRAPWDRGEVRRTAFAAVVALGEGAVAPLCRAAADPETPFALKKTVAGMLDHIGDTTAVAPIAAYVLGWDRIPDGREPALWTAVLRELGGRESEEALQRVASHVEALRRGPSDAEIAARELDRIRLAPREPAPPVNPEDGIYALVLVKALGGAKPLTIHLDRKGGHFVRAFGTAETFNQVPHDVDASSLELQGSVLSGKVEVTVHADPYVPADGRPVPCAYVIQAAADGAGVRGAFEGRYGAQPVRGEVWGLIQARPPKPEPAWFHLRLVNALDGIYGSSYHHRGHVSFTLAGGKAYDGNITEFDQTVPVGHSVGWAGQAERIDAQFTGDALTATVCADVQSGRGLSISWGPHTFILRGQVIGRVVAGTFDTYIEDTHIKRRRFVGTVEVGAEPNMDLDGHALVMVLDGALDGGRALKVVMQRQEGEFVGAYAVVGNVRCGVDVSGLAVEDRTLRGSVRLTVSGRGGAPVACAYTVAAEARHGRLSGTFTGRCGNVDVRGDVSGAFREPPR